MTYWNYGLPYQPVNENQPPRRLIPLNRLKLIAIVVGFTVIVTLLGVGITLIVVSKTKSRHFGLEAISMATATTTKRPLSRPTPSVHQTLTNLSKTCQLPTGIPIYNNTGEVIVGDSKLDQLNNPSDIFLDNKGNLYIADTDNNRILKYVKNTKNIIIVAQGNGVYSDLNAPTSLFVDEYDNIYIVDNQRYLNAPRSRSYYRIFMYWPKSPTLQHEYEGILLLNGTTGDSYGIYLDSELNIYITVSDDPDNEYISHGTYGAGKVIKWFSPSYNYSITLLDKKILGIPDNDYIGFSPKKIYIDSSQNDLYVIHWLAFPSLFIKAPQDRIIKWSGNTRANISFSPITDEPIDIALDCNGNIYIINDIDHSIKFFPSTSTYIEGGIILDIQNANDMPTSIVLDSQNGDLYVANFYQMGGKTSSIGHDEESQVHDPTINNGLFQRCFSHKADGFEIFTLIWLDKKSNDDSLDSLRTKNLLLQLNNNNCLFYNDLNVFLSDYDHLKLTKEKILLIISGSFAREILSQIRDIATIIIFCSDYNKYYPLFKQYSNVCDICTEHDSLKSRIQREVPSLKFNLFHNQTLRTIRPLSQDSINTGAYFSYISFVDILKQMPKTKQAKEIMITKCLDYYRKDDPMMRSIKRFRDTYSPENVIDWYTEDSFVYRLVNQAFRTEDITLWYLFRFYITDLSTQLEKIHTEQKLSSNLTVYRGQSQLPIVEFDYLKANISTLIATNGFLSTSKDLNIAKKFILDAEDGEGFKVVLFVITVDASNLKNSIFADIDLYIGNSGESEVLFDIGSVFKIENVEFDHEQKVWVIGMLATDEGTKEMKEQMKSIRKKFQTGNVNMLFGRLLIDMGHYAKAESYFQLMLQVLPKNHTDFALAYDHMGDLYMRMTNWNEALRNFNRAYQIKKQIFRSTNHSYLAMSFNNIGTYYSAIEDFDKALCYYRKALKCQNDSSNQAITILNIGNALTRKNEYDKALELCLEAREQLEKIQPNLHVEIIHCQGIIGDIYFNQGVWKEAEEFYLTAFLMTKKYLLIGDLLQIKSIKAVIELYEKQGEKQNAMNFCSEQLSIYLQYLPSNHTSIAHLLIIQGKLYGNENREQIHCYEKALHILEKNLHFEYASTANCLILIGEYYERGKMYEEAVGYYKRANEIQKKIYPIGHPIFSKIQNLIISVDNMY